jgi:Family of unknown function (DUF6395)
LLPGEVPLIHFKRVSHQRVPNRATHVRADVQAELVSHAAREGRRVFIVESDLEFLVGPFPMFPEWTTVAVPVILLADHLGLGGVGFGTIMGSRYLGNGYRYTDVPGKERWASLFRAVGLPFVRPACGMTEVSTIRLAGVSDLGYLMRSCALGDLDGPCLNCAKCLRKELTTAGLEERPLNATLLRNLGTGHPAVEPLKRPPPYYFQHVLEYGLARAKQLDQTFLASAVTALRPTIESTEWATKYYRPAITNDVPDYFRADCRLEVEKVMQYMSAHEERIVETWDAASRTENY